MPGLSASMDYLANEGSLRRMFTGTYGTSAFKFQPRRESVDWRRLSAIDVDRVAQELDVTTLQDHITGVTYCNLDSERCAYCQQPVDPVLLKVLKMAQLIIEYLLHSQEYLSANIVSLEEKLQSTLEQQEQTEQKLGKQAEELKGVKEESRRRKKMLGMQQLLIQAGANNYHKCHLCDKAFINNSYLQGHIQRRHIEVKQSEKQKQQMKHVEDGIEELRAKLKQTQSQLEAEREAEKQRQLQEAENIRLRETEAKREFDRWKDEERMKLYQEIDNLKQLLLNEFKSVTSQNSMLEEKLQALQTHTVVESHLGTLKDDDAEDRQKQAKEVQDMKEKLEHQKFTWKRKLKNLQEEHLAEKKRLKDENERLRVSLSQDQRKAADHFQSQMDLLSAKCQDQANIIKSQEETIKRLSLRKEEAVIHQVAKTEETEEDSTEEELEDSLDGKQKVLEALRRNPNLMKQFRPILEDTLEEKLESMGLKRGTKRISDQTHRNLEAMLKAHREQKAKRFSELLRLRDKLNKEVARKILERQQNENILLLPVNVTAVKGQRSPLTTREAQQKSRKEQVESQSRQTASPKPSPHQSKANHTPATPRIPVPTPRSRVHGPTGPPASPGRRLSTPTFTSEDDSEGDHISHSNLQAPSRIVARDDNDWDWSDTETSDEKVPKPMASSGGITSTGTRVQSLAKTLEKQLVTPGKKPAGGVGLFLASDAGPSKTAISVKKPQFSEDDSDLDISSLEEILQDLDVNEKNKQPQHLSRSQPVEKHGRISTDSQSTSVWSSSSARVVGW